MGCPISSPFLLCLSNYKCGYIYKSSDKSIYDYIWGMNNNKCVLASDFPEGLDNIKQEFFALGGEL